MKNFIIIISIFIASSCTQKNNSEAVSDIKSLSTKTISIPKLNKLSYLTLSDTLDISQYYDNILNSKNKIIIYADSLSCVECDMKFDEWKLKIRELKIRNIDICIFFLLNEKFYQDVRYLIERDMFDAPIFFESGNSFLIENNLPKTFRKRTFILNGDNEIVLIGDPINNEDIWELYKKKLSLNY